MIKYNGSLSLYLSLYKTSKCFVRRYICDEDTKGH